MAKVTVLYWQDIPAVVEVAQGRKRHKLQLSERFQELIDKVAMRKGLFGTDAYLEQWRRGEPSVRDGAPRSLAETVAAELESRYDEIERVAMADAAESRRQRE